MLSESARMSSAAEARFRIDAPNSAPRVIKVIALDEPSEMVVRQLAGTPWNNAQFFTAAPAAADGDATALDTARAWIRDLTGAGSAEWLRDLDGAAADLTEQVAGADLVVMVAAAGHSADLSALIGAACSDRRVTTTALLVGSATASDKEVAETLARLRPWSLMVVMANTDEYIEDMLIALRGR